MKIQKIILFASLLLIFVVGINFALAEDDNEREDEDRYQPAQVVPTTETPIVPEVTAAPTLISEPVTEIKAVTTTQTKEAVREVLVDSDQDGVIDKLDIHPGEDDFAFVSDDNQNGIADDLEYLLTNSR